MSGIKNIAIGSLALGALAVVLIAWQVGFSQIIDLILAASVVFLACYLVTSLLIATVLTFKWKLILSSYGIKVPFGRLFAYRLVGYSVSYLTPTAHAGGEPIRAMLLKREGISTNTAFSSVIIDKSIEIMADVVFFFIGALLLLNSVAVDETAKAVMLGISLVLILLMGVFIGGVLSKGSMFIAVFRFLRLDRFKKLKSIEKNLGQIEKEVELFYRNKKEYFLAIILIVFVLWVLMFFEYRFALLLFGTKATPMQIFLILTGVGLAYTLPVPAAMGTLELGQLSATKVLGLSGVTGMALAFLVRTRDLIWTGIGLVFLTFYQFSFKDLSKETAKIDKEFQQGDFKRRMS